MLKQLSNRSEQLLGDVLAAASANYGATVYRKIRIADVVAIDRLSDWARGSFALKAHFDFVVADDQHRPLFAVEFDGLGHVGVNDTVKDQIARESGLALFRIRDGVQRASLNQLHFLGYLVHFWHHALWFDQMKLSGELQRDESFMMSGFLRADAKHLFDSEWDFAGAGDRQFNRVM